MSESLLSFSEVLLFGRVVADLGITSLAETASEAKAATTDNLGSLSGSGPVDGQTIAAGDNVLVRAQDDEKQNGLYAVTAGDPLVWTQNKLPKGALVDVKNGSMAGVWEQMSPLKPTPAQAKQKFKEVPGRPERRRGSNKQLEDQLFDADARFARIYGFTYEGTYYELPAPVLFLVHGEGESATRFTDPANPGNNMPANAPGKLGSRAPNNPSLSGVGAADFQVADDIRVWSYDKADYTIRMDVLTGMFQEVLLDLFFDVELPAIRGAMVGGAGGPKGAMVSGAKVRGAMVRGAMVRGAMVGGNRNRD